MKKVVIFALMLALLVTACAKPQEIVEEIPPIVEITPEPADAPVLEDHSRPTPAPTPQVTPAIPVITPSAPDAPEETPIAVQSDELRYRDDRVGRIMEDTEKFTATHRLAGSEGEKAALDYAAQVFASLGLTVGRQEVTQAGEYPFASYNIIGTRPAKKADAPILILAAHADSVEWSVGATDNAAGLATLLEAARQASLIAGDGVEIRFIAFTAEEWQAKGAESYLSVLTKEEKARIAGMLDLDMFCSANASITYAYFEDHNLCFDLWTDLTAAAGRCGRMLLLSRGNQLPSDAWAFEQAGIPAVLLTHDIVEGEYHSENDTPDKIDQEKLLFALDIAVEWIRTALEA